MIGIPIGITSSAIGLNICAIIAGIKKYKSIFKNKKRKHYKIVMLARSKLNKIEVLISRSLNDLNISHDEFVLINNLLPYYIKMKEIIRNLKTESSLLYCLKCSKNAESKNPIVAKTKNGRILLSSKFAVWDSKKSKFIKEEESSRLLSSLQIETLLRKTLLVGPLLF